MTSEEFLKIMNSNLDELICLSNDCELSFNELLNRTCLQFTKAYINNMYALNKNN